MCRNCGKKMKSKKYYIFKNKLSSIESEELDYKYYNLKKKENLDIMAKFACGCLNKDKFNNNKIAGIGFFICLI